MKQFFFFLSALFSFSVIYAQNVGIGTTTPSEILDVNGNVNIAGTVKANGIAGTNGQVLSSTGSGLGWVSIGGTMGYRKCIMITSNTSWTVPANVTEVMVEVWGAGAGGAANAGGISGSYSRTVKTVTPGKTVNCTIGT